MLTHPVRPGADGLVDMDARRRLTRTRAADVGCALNALAHGVIEDDDAIGLQLCTHKGFDGGVVDAPDFSLVVKILHRGGMPDELKALTVERECLGVETPVK